MNGSQNEGKSIALYQFEGKGLRVLDFRGQRVIIAKDLGAALGYSKDGRRLVALITGEWAAEFAVGTDTFIAEGNDLATFKLDPSDGSSPIDKHTRSVMLLSEAAVHKVLLKTERPVGIRLRAFLATDIMPRLVRGEAIPARNSAPVVVQAEKALNGSDKSILREARLYAKALQAAGIDPKAAGAWLAGVFQGVTGISTTKLLPVLEPEEQGKLPSEIAADLQREIGPAATEAKVGIVISRLGLRGKAGYSWQVMSKARGHEKSVQPFMYNAAAQALIIPEVKAWVQREADEAMAKEARRLDREQKKLGRVVGSKKKKPGPDGGDLFGAPFPA